ncbi:MAG TPA: hypothetical protein VFJ82_23000 [Longimicrobium sp.]|nr:hypothetical protein [Longimicrobium sp.]
MFGGIDFMFIGIGVAIAARAVGSARAMRYRRMPLDAQPTPIADPRVPMLQAEVEELRTQVERLSAAEHFYAQLNAPAASPPGASASPAPRETPSS